MRTLPRRVLSALAAFALVAGSVAIATPASAANPVPNPPNNSFINTSSVTLNWAPVSNVYEYRVTYGLASGGARYNWYNEYPTGYPVPLYNGDGRYFWYVDYRACAFCSWYSATFTYYFTLDTTAPVVSDLATVPASTVVRGAALTLNGTVSDTNLSSARAFIDGVDLGAFTSGMSIATTGLSIGSHTLRVDAADAAGNTATSSTTFDVTPQPWPANPVVTPANGATIGTRDVAVSWVAKDAYSGQYYVGVGSAPTFSSPSTTGTSLTVTAPADGTYTVRVGYLEDGPGGSQSFVYSPPRLVTIDTVAPIITNLLTNRSTPIAPGATVQLLGQVTDATTTTARVLLDGIDRGAFTSGGTIATTGLTAGTHTLQVKATDAAGNVGTGSITFDVVTDWAPDPITYPADGALIGTNTFTPLWNPAPVGAAQIYVITQNPTTGTINSAFAPGASGGTITRGDGVYSLRIAYVPTGGGQVPSPTRTVTIDTQLPSMTAFALNAPSRIQAGTPVQLSGQASDLTLASTTWQLDNGAVLPYSGGATIATTGLEDGAHPVIVRATDGLGHIATRVLSFTVDSTAPSISDVTPANGSRAAVSGLSYRASIDETASWNLSVDGTPFKTGSVGAAGGQATVAIAAGSWADGSTHTFLLTVRDVAGNTNTSQTTVVADAAGPAVTITTPDDGALVSAWPGVSGTVGDAAGVQGVSVEFHAVNSDDTCGAAVGAAHAAQVVGDHWESATAPVDGEYCVVAIATDAVGNTSTSRVFVTRDATAPAAFAVDSPTGWVTDSGEFSWTDSSDLHGVAYTVHVEDATGVTDYPVASGTTLPIDLAPGDYTWWVSATDGAGNVTDTESAELHVTGVVELEAPDAAALFSGSLAVAWSGGYHAPGGVDHYEVEFAHADGETFTTDVDGDDDSLLQAFAAELPDGEWTVRVRAVATDLVAELGTRFSAWSAPVTVSRDATAPELTITSPADHSILSSWTGASGTASDATGLASVDLELRRVDRKDQSCGALVAAPSAIAVAPGGAWSTSAVDLADGDYCVTVTAIDPAGNTTARQRTVTIDGTAPGAFELNAPFGWMLDSSEFSWDAADDATAVEYTVHVDDGTDVTDHSVASGTSLALDLEPGDYDWWVTAVDAAGNSTDSSSARVHVVGVPSLETPDAGAGFSDELAVGWTDSVNAPGGVDHFEVEFAHGAETFSTEVDGDVFALSQLFAKALPSGDWTVRVRAVYSDFEPALGTLDGAWSEAVVVSRDASSPSLTSPKNGATQAGYTLTFRWAPVEGADHYELRASPNAAVDVTGRLIDGEVVEVADVVYTSTVTADVTAWWQVRAIDATGHASSWSDPWKLVVDHRYVAPKPPAAPGSDDPAVTSDDEEPATEPTPDPEQSQEAEPTSEPTDSDDGDTSGAGETEAAGESGAGDIPAYPFVIGGVILLLGGLVFLFRFLYLRRN